MVIQKGVFVIELTQFMMQSNEVKQELTLIEGDFIDAKSLI